MALINGGVGGGDVIPPQSSGSSIEEITSIDDSVTITDPEGPVTDLSVAPVSSLVLALLNLPLGTPLSVYGDPPALIDQVITDPVTLLPSSSPSPLQIPLTIPLTTVAPAGILFTITEWEISNVDTTHDSFAFFAGVTISNLDGTETMTVGGSVDIAQSGPGQSGAVGTGTGQITVQSQVGADLSYDDTTGEITSAAGGTYGAIVYAQVGYD